MSLAVKSGRPLSREGLVQRPRLLARLIDARELPLTTIVAPAGYGKTSLLAEWAAQDSRASVWLDCEEWHSDPIVLARAISAAFAEFELFEDDPLLQALLSPDPDLLGSVLPGLATSFEHRTPPFALIVDDAHLLTDPGAFSVLATIAQHLPSGSQLLVASRKPLALPLGRLRAHRALLELGVKDLAMSCPEATGLLRAAGVRVAPGVVQALVERTEGWPAGLYLAALSAHDEPDVGEAFARFTGDHHVVADYLGDEFLTGLDDEQLDFLVLSSVLEQLSGPICDALLDRDDSVHMLDRLARDGFPLHASGSGCRAYRLHRLLREMLSGELRHRHPGREARLHLRASAFYAAQGDFDRAISHAVAAPDAQSTGDLLWGQLPRYVSEGRNELVQAWLGGFSDNDLSSHASLALTAAYSALALGDRRRAEHFGLIGAAALSRETSPPQVPSLPTGVALIEAVVGHRGVAPMGRHAARAYALEEDDSPWRSICLLFQGVADHLTGDRDRAREHLEQGVHRSAVSAPHVETLCLSQLAMITVEEGDWDSGIDLIARAVRQVERHGLSSYPTAALTFAVSADVRSHIGRVDEGKRDARRAAHLLAHISDFIPWYEAETRIMLARAALRLADIAAARTLLAEASQLARRVPDAVVFGGWLDDTWGLIDSASTAALAGPAALTMAELRILRFLPTHLSFREIGLRLHVSTNTVKTQAHAVYRKLGVSSRSDAVARAAAIGLLES
ncbi:MAG TPA: LuxR C-terminal-related transcriptional regulator [Solirubrobacteraceae bacterium]|jgi:LuxR family maltose regulon positive regulatory protein|nr:LuxR C-terminal-related transcriptional regulator [Solirubrobacteraceae bacterium]